MRWLESRAWSRLGSVVTWSVAGFAFGLLFPIVSLILLSVTDQPEGIIDLHTQQPLLWVIDLAPVILAGAGFVIGTLMRRVADAEREQRRLAGELARTWNLEIADRAEDMHTIAQSGMERAAAISHELRTPLTAVLGFVDLLDGAGPADQADVAEYVREIRSSCAFMLEMVNEFLADGRSIAGVFNVHNEPVCPDDVVADVLRHLAPMATQRGLRLQHLEGPGITAEADPRRLRQVLTNLAVNSIRYTRSGTVTVATKAASSAVVITVSDTGSGMSPDELGRLFRPYERGDNESEPGTGLGLGLSRSMVEAMGGRLAADSPGKGLGSTMTITLHPARHEASARG
jgi:signal transduction histidine kinase